MFVGKPERRPPDVLGEPLADEEPLVVVGADRDRAPGEAVDRGFDVGEVWSGCTPRRCAPSMRAVERGEGVAPDRWATHGPWATVPAAVNARTVGAHQVVGNPDQHELGVACGLGRVEHRHPGQVPSRALDGGIAAGDGDDPVAG